MHSWFHWNLLHMITHNNEIKQLYNQYNKDDYIDDTQMCNFFLVKHERVIDFIEIVHYHTLIQLFMPMRHHPLQWQIYRGKHGHDHPSFQFLISYIKKEKT